MTRLVETDHHLLFVSIGRVDVVRLFGDNVKRERLRQGLTQDALAAEAGMRRSYLSDLEWGTRNPSVHALGRLAMALEVEAADLLRFIPADRAARCYSIEEGGDDGCASARHILHTGIKAGLSHRLRPVGDFQRKPVRPCIYLIRWAGFPL